MTKAIDTLLAEAQVRMKEIEGRASFLLADAQHDRDEAQLSVNGALERLNRMKAQAYALHRLGEWLRSPAPDAVVAQMWKDIVADGDLQPDGGLEGCDADDVASECMFFYQDTLLRGVIFGNASEFSTVSETLKQWLAGCFAELMDKAGY